MSVSKAIRKAWDDDDAISDDEEEDDADYNQDSLCWQHAPSLMHKAAQNTMSTILREAGIQQGHDVFYPVFSFNQNHCRISKFQDRRLFAGGVSRSFRTLFKYTTFKITKH